MEKFFGWLIALAIVLIILFSTGWVKLIATILAALLATAGLGFATVSWIKPGAGMRLASRSSESQKPKYLF
jgi:hypothetical protein